MEITIWVGPFTINTVEGGQLAILDGTDPKPTVPKLILEKDNDSEGTVSNQPMQRHL